MEESNFVKEVSLPLYQAKGWMKLLGVVMIVQGIFTALTIIGIIIAWLPIWLGVLLFQAASKAEAAQMAGQQVPLMESLNKIKTYFVINGVLMLIMLIIAGLAIIISGGAIFSLMHRM